MENESRVNDVLIMDPQSMQQELLRLRRELQALLQVKNELEMNLNAAQSEKVTHICLGRGLACEPRLSENGDSVGWHIVGFCGWMVADQGVMRRWLGLGFGLARQNDRHH